MSALLIAGLPGCSDDSGANGGDYAGDGAFGEGFRGSDADSEDQDAGSSGGLDGGIAGSSVRLRVLQGVLNLRAAYLCHDPDFELEDGGAGPEPAVELPLELVDGGLELGEATAYASMPAMISGAITVHRLPSSDAGLADAGMGALDAGSMDAAADAGPAAADPPVRCDRASLEAVLPLPMPAAWVDPPRVDADASAARDASGLPEAGPSLEARGFASVARGSEPLTLFGSGLTLDPAELERRVEEHRKRYVEDHPGADTDVVEQAAEQYRRALEAAYGPRFLLSRAQPPTHAGSFSLHFSHLIPDVPGKADAGSGALHVCITVGTMEGIEPSDAGTAGFDFRNYVALGDALDPALAYRFRVFVQREYAAEQKTCATTSMKPVAELMVDAGSFAAGGSYSLVAWGALYPEAICTTYAPGTLIRPGCAQGVDKLRAGLQIIDNE